MKGALVPDKSGKTPLFMAVGKGYHRIAEICIDNGCDVNHMDKHGFQYCIPQHEPGMLETRPAIPLSSSYISRVLDQLPQQGTKRPWRIYQNYLLDLFYLGLSNVDDGTMTFG